MISIKELRIGSHVLQYGVRVKVVEIDPPYVGVIYYEFDSVVDTEIEYEKAKNLDPIPITEELLKELGFEEVFSKEYDAPIEDEYPRISLAQYEGGLYQLQVAGTLAYVRDLHTLQNFVYLTTKKELI